jgi:hypothetical protein
LNVAFDGIDGAVIVPPSPPFVEKVFKFDFVDVVVVAVAEPLTLFVLYDVDVDEVAVALPLFVFVL